MKKLATLILTFFLFGCSTTAYRQEWNLARSTFFSNIRIAAATNNYEQFDQAVKQFQEEAESIFGSDNKKVIRIMEILKHSRAADNMTDQDKNELVALLNGLDYEAARLEQKSENRSRNATAVGIGILGAFVGLAAGAASSSRSSAVPEDTNGQLTFQCGSIGRSADYVTGNCF